MGKSLQEQGEFKTRSWWVTCRGVDGIPCLGLPCKVPRWEGLGVSRNRKPPVDSVAGGRGEVPTHTCAAPGSCWGRPGAGPVGSGSSADRPAWLRWGATAGRALRQGP